MLNPVTNKIVGIIAPKGTGKTHLAAQMIKELERVAVFDPIHDPAYAACCEELVIGSPRRFGTEIFCERFRVVLRPTWYDPDSLDCVAFDWFCTLSFLRGNMTAIIDEAHLFCSSHRCPPELLNASRLGRHSKLSLVYITQSFTAVHRILTLNTNTFVFFKVIDPRDLDGIKDRCGIETAEQVQALRKLEFHEQNEPIPGQRLVWKDTETTPEIFEA
jgi:hypothetical protein